MTTTEGDLNSVAVIIPARYKSSRFPGKPLASILGKPMIVYVAETAEIAVGRENVFIATDSTEICKVVEEYGFKCIMTSTNNPTGTDRVAEACTDTFVTQNIIVNLQGDEPLVKPEDVKKIIAAKLENINTIISTMSHLPSH